jgi:hypothetical protein
MIQQKLNFGTSRKQEEDNSKDAASYNPHEIFNDM